MSTSDYNRGASDAAWLASLQTKSQTKAVAQQWRNYSETLRLQLEEARLAELSRAAELAGRDAQQKALREALRQLNPGHPLLRALPALGNEAMVRHFAANGYIFDPENRLLTKA